LKEVLNKIFSLQNLKASPTLHLKLDTMKLERNMLTSTRDFGLHLAKRIMRKVFMFHCQR